jgi:hypothetical protein
MKRRHDILLEMLLKSNVSFSSIRFMIICDTCTDIFTSQE